VGFPFILVPGIPVLVGTKKHQIGNFRPLQRPTSIADDQKQRFQLPPIGEKGFSVFAFYVSGFFSIKLVSLKAISMFIPSKQHLFLGSFFFRVE